MRAYRFLLLIVVLLTYTCGGSGGGGGTNSLPSGEGDSRTTTDAGGGTGSTTTPATMTLAASPSTINYLDTSTITATVLTSSGASVADGTVVTFSVTQSGYGSVTAQSTTVSGVATATFTASNTAGTVSITGSSGSASNNVSVIIQQTGAPASINLTTDPAALPVLATSSITATVLDNLGANVPDGTTVTFSASPSGYGSVTTQATTVSGLATATFTASNTPGTVVVTGTASSVSDTASIVISAAATGSIEFDSATPTVIGISGSGQTETSLIKFLVKDINGNNVVDGTSVSFLMYGPSGGRLPAAGGEYIGNSDASPTTASASTVSGAANVYLHSGMVAGPVIIIATVSGMSSASTAISIGGGVPNDAHLTLTTSKWNLEGLGWANIQANISVFMADRFGNYNILENTAVSFYAESGAIDRNDVTGADGSATVVFRTQNPVPYDVELQAWENSLCSTLESTYGTLANTSGTPVDIYVGSACSSGHPRDGWATIMVTTRGEEAFADLNGNGIYDGADTKTDTTQEAFLDANDSGTYDDGTGADPAEVYIDDDASNTCDDSVNGSWDSNKTLYTSLNLLITGSPYYIDTNLPNGFVIANAGSQSFKVLVADTNLNSPIAGTILTVATTKGTLIGPVSYTFPDVFVNGPLEINYTLIDAAPSTFPIPDPDPATVTIKVTYKGTDYYGPTITGGMF